MASLTLTLSGSDSDLNSNYFPPIELDETAEYVCGLVDFQTFMSIPNITDSNNRLYYVKKFPLKLLAGSDHTIFEIREMLVKQLKPDMKHPTIEEFQIEFERVIRDGSIEVEMLLRGDEVQYLHFNADSAISYKYKDYIQLPIGSYEIAEIEQQINKMFKEISISCTVTIRANSNTLKSHIKSNRKLYFDDKNSIASILGFSGDRSIAPNTEHESDFIIKISRVNVIKIECNIVEGAYSNGNAMHTLHEFYPTVGIGYKIVEVPQNVIYLPLTVRSIHDINIRIVDQNNQLIDFRGEPVSVRLHIKKLK